MTGMITTAGMTISQTSSQTYCSELLRTVRAWPQTPLAAYHRYWWGQKTVKGWLLTLFPLSSIFFGLHVSSYFFILLFAFACWRTEPKSSFSIAPIMGLFLWYLLFRNHTWNHVGLMQRHLFLAMALPFCAEICLFQKKSGR